MQRVAFDADDMIRQMRSGQEAALAEARATITDPKTLAGIEAQVRLLPVLECTVREHIALREAGFDEGFIAALMGVMAGKILHDVWINSVNRDYALEVFNRNLRSAFTGDGSIGKRVFGVTGVTAGRA